MQPDKEVELPKYYRNKDGRIFEATEILHRFASKMKLTPCDGPEEAAPPAKDDPERDEAVSLYEAKFNKKPHYKWSAEKIREELAKDPA